MSFSALGANDVATASSSYIATDRASPLSRFRSRNADRAPGCVAIVGRTDSLYSLIAWSRSDFLYVVLTTPACISHLREKRSTGAQSWECAPPILLRPLLGESTPVRRVGDE